MRSRKGKKSAVRVHGFSWKFTSVRVNSAEPSAIKSFASSSEMSWICSLEIFSMS